MINPRNVTISMGMIILIMPYWMVYIQYSILMGWFIGIFSLLWHMQFSEWSEPIFWFGYFSGLESLWVFQILIFILHLPLIYTTVRYCKGNGGMIKVYIAGVITLLPVIIYSIWYSLITGIPFVPMIPLPIAFIFSLYITKLTKS